MDCCLPALGVKKRNIGSINCRRSTNSSCTSDKCRKIVILRRSDGIPPTFLGLGHIPMATFSTEVLNDFINFNMSWLKMRKTGRYGISRGHVPSQVLVGRRRISDSCGSSGALGRAERHFPGRLASNLFNPAIAALVLWFRRNWRTNPPSFPCPSTVMENVSCGFHGSISRFSYCKEQRHMNVIPNCFLDQYKNQG